MRNDIAPRPIAWTALAIATTVAVVIGAVFLLLRTWDTPAGASRVAMPDPVIVPGPLLESAPQPDLARDRAEKQRVLNSAAWVDADRGIARIPIADAMALLGAAAASAAPPAVAASRPAAAAAAAQPVPRRTEGRP